VCFFFIEETYGRGSGVGVPVSDTGGGVGGEGGNVGMGFEYDFVEIA
jgi:hypothetical protein